jgi:Rrf2 family cysteine metabolism transcriptional repressor
MKFSTRATYGLRAMLYLADHYGESAVSISQIAEEERISAAYLEQILSRIKKEGWVKSVRGPRGGYVLTAKPSQISVGKVLVALGEDIQVSGTAEPAAKRRRPAAHAASELFWKKLSGAFAEALDRVTLEALIQAARQEPQAKAQGLPIHFNI